VLLVFERQAENGTVCVAWSWRHRASFVLSLPGTSLSLLPVFNSWPQQPVLSASAGRGIETLLSVSLSFRSFSTLQGRFFSLHEFFTRNFILHRERMPLEGTVYKLCGQTGGSGWVQIEDF
ncbi:hypothetical protein NPIL_689711, partial [Nephila pilipes]